MRITGTEIKQLRDTLGMSVPHFAELLGIHLATVYRWESVGSNAPPLGPLHQRLLAHLQQQANVRALKIRQQWAGQLLQAVLIGGTLAALAQLLSNEKPKKKRRKKTQ